jgi:hypothetical protein
MEPPVNRPTYPGSAKKQGGLDPQQGYPSSGGVSDSSRSGKFRLLVEAAKPGSLVETRRSLRLSPMRAYPAMRQPWVWEQAQIVSRQPENAVASASISWALRLPHSRHPTSV